MTRAAFFVVLSLAACGKTAATDEHPRTFEPVLRSPPLPPDPSTWPAADAAFEAGLTARDGGDHALAEARFLESARLRRPNGFALARAGLAALAQGAEMRANDQFRSALVELEQQTHEHPRPAVHVPLICWGVFYTSIELRWVDDRHLEMRCQEGISIIDVPAHEEVERYPPTPYPRPEGYRMTTDRALRVDVELDGARLGVGRVKVSDPPPGRPRAVFPGVHADMLGDGGIAVTDGRGLTIYDAKLHARQRIDDLGWSTVSPNGRSIAHLVPQPNPDSDQFHRLAPMVRDVATGKDVDLSDLLEEVPLDHVTSPTVLARTTHSGGQTRGSWFAWSVAIAGRDWDWNDEVLCQHDDRAQHAGELLTCVAPEGPIAMTPTAKIGDAHCRVGRFVLPLAVCSSRSSDVTR